jgi:DNA repair exonuclease SbcCD ATPase subunit
MPTKPTYEQLRQRIEELEAQIIEMRREEDERKELVGKLQQALAQGDKLRGTLLICSSCKKIRDDNGFWYEIEPYIASHSQVGFSHSICPDCEKELYPEYSRRRDSATDRHPSTDDRQAPQEVTFIERRSGRDRRSFWVGHRNDSGG